MAEQERWRREGGRPELTDSRDRGGRGLWLGDTKEKQDPNLQT